MADKVYEQTDGYMPRTDSGFRDWLANFSSLISADWNRYSLSEADANVIAGHNASYEAVYVPCQSPATRTTGLITQKDAVKASAIASCRVYSQIIKMNQGVDDQDKIELGLHLNDTTRTPIPPPDSAPLLSIIAAFSGEHIISYADENSPHLRKKPDGVKQIQIYRQVAAGAVTLPDGATEVGLFTKLPVKVQTSQNDVGLTATYFGRWVNAKGETGPWSLPVSMTIAFGGPVESQIPDGGQTESGDDGLQLAA